VHALVRRAEGITGLFHQLLLEGEMGEGVVHQFIDHLGHGQPLHALLRDVEMVEHLHDAQVLAVDDIDAGVEVVLPDQYCHVRVPCNGRADSAGVAAQRR